MSVEEWANHDLFVMEISGEENENCWLNITKMPWSSSKIRQFTNYLQMKCFLEKTCAYNEKASENGVNWKRNWMVFRCRQGYVNTRGKFWLRETRIKDLVCNLSLWVPEDILGRHIWFKDGSSLLPQCSRWEVRTREACNNLWYLC